MRILAVGNMYPPHHQGGYELVWQSVMRQARDSGHSVRILVSTHRDRSVLSPDEPDVHRTLRWYWDWERHEFPKLPIRQRVALERANSIELERHLAAFRPDVITWWSMGHMSLSMIEQARRRRLPSVFSVHNDWLVYGWKADQWTRIWPSRNRLVGRAADHLLGIPTEVRIADSGQLLFNSDYTLRQAQRKGIDVTGAAVIHPGIEARFLEAVPQRPWRWRLLYIGRIDRQKGVDTAVASLSHLPSNAHLTIVGKGDTGFADELRRQATSAGLDGRVVFAPFGDADVVRSAYADADAVLFPVRWEEPWGLVPLEAMGVGRPVISTARGGTAEFLRDELNALVIEPDDPRALAAAASRLADDEALRTRLREGGRATAAAHSAEAFDRDTLLAIEQAARGDG